MNLQYLFLLQIGPHRLTNITRFSNVFRTNHDDIRDARLGVVEEENHRFVVHAGLHKAHLEVLMPLDRSVVLCDLDLIGWSETHNPVSGPC